MASVTITKHTMVSASSGQMRHLYRDNENYGNPDIDTTLSGGNIMLGCQSSSEARERLHSRIDEVDEILPPLRVKKDRVVAVEYCVPAPREKMKFETQIEFLKRAYEELKIEYGEENIICGAIHVDEMHDYVRFGETHQSRAHLHVIGVPFVENKGINGKQFLTKAQYGRANACMDRLCMSASNGQLMFQDGTRQKSLGKVEELKAMDSLQKEHAAIKIHASKAKETLREAFQEAQTELKTVQGELFTTSAESEALKGEYEALKKRYKQGQEVISTQDGTIKSLKEEKETLQFSVNMLGAHASDLKARLSNTTDDLDKANLSLVKVQNEVVVANNDLNSLKSKLQDMSDVVNNPVFKTFEKGLEELNTWRKDTKRKLLDCYQSIGKVPKEKRREYSEIYKNTKDAKKFVETAYFHNNENQNSKIDLEPLEDDWER